MKKDIFIVKFYLAGERSADINAPIPWSYLPPYKRYSNAVTAVQVLLGKFKNIVEARIDRITKIDSAPEEVAKATIGRAGSDNVEMSERRWNIY